MAQNLVKDNPGIRLLNQIAEAINMPAPTNSLSTVPPNSKIQPQKQRDRKQAFNRDFKQAVFQRRGTEDGSSQIHVSFSTSGAKPVEKMPVTSAPPQSSKTKLSSGHYKDIIHVDKKKIQEEVDNLPKPDHLKDAEKELLAFDGLLKFKPEFKFPETFMCRGCLDSFPSQFSLKDHLERQSYSLNFACQDCGLRQTFYNKCALYTHIATHRPMDKDIYQSIAVKCTTLSVLPRAQLKATPVNSIDPPNSNINNTQTSEPMVNGSGPKPTQPTQITKTQSSTSLAEKSDGGKSDKDADGDLSQSSLVANNEDSLKMEDNFMLDESSQQSTGLKEESNAETEVGEAEDDEQEEESSGKVCSECSQKFETEWTLRTHFTLAKDGEKPSYCMPCRIELPSSCSFKAHARLHSISEPYTCPDCGLIMDKKTVFLKHVRLQCLHYSKLSEYICPGCPETFLHADDQLRHLQSLPQHLRFDGERSYYKCNGCPKAFKSVAAHSKHESCPGAGCKMVHMCNNCTQQTVFRSWPELMEHRSQAHPDLKWIPKRARVYSCYLCTHKSRSKQGFLDHLSKVHGKKKIDFMCENCGVEVDSISALDVHKVNCPFKRTVSNNKPKMIAERKPKLSSSSSVNSDASSIQNSQSNSQTNESTTQTATTPSTQTINHSQPPADMEYLMYKPSFNCHICLAECSNYAKLRDHVQKKHGGQGLIYECWLCRDRGNSANFYRQSQLDKHMADVHKVQIAAEAPQLVNENGEADSDSETPAKKMKIWGDADQEYQCCKCDFNSFSVDEFKEHIKGHKLSVDNHQCAECGMCFPVQLALKRHLFAVHKVTDYAKYSRHQYMIEYEKQLNDSNGKCPVCGREYEDESQFRMHLRTHGMMYINTKCLPCNS